MFVYPDSTSQKHKRKFKQGKQKIKVENFDEFYYKVNAVSNLP